jgi:hypothetical protein
MLKRVLLALFFIGSLAWIGYMGLEIYQTSNDFSESYLFSPEDEQLLIVNRPSEVSFDGIDFINQSPLFSIIAELDDSAYATGYFSAKRSHFLLEKKNNWSEKDIKQLFADCGELTNLTSSTFTLGTLKGRYRKLRLYVQEEGIELSRTPLNEFVHDKKASASILQFGDQSNVNLVTDVYFKKGGKVDYITRNEQIAQGKQVHDEKIFARFVSRKFKSYHFLERDYYATLDTAFASGPMIQWLKNGFVKLDYGGEIVYISDYVNGQDPILILNDLQQTNDEISFKFQLTKDFPASNRSYCVKYLEDLVVIAHEEETCDQILADYQVGNTISLDNATHKRLYSDLPRAVSERKITSESRISKAVYQGYLLETRYGKVDIEQTSVKESIALTCNFEVADFVVLPGLGNVVAMSADGQVACFKNEKEAWRKKIDGGIKSDLQLIDLHGNGEDHVLLNTEDEIHLWTINGDPVSGFPIKLESLAKNEVRFYRWKEKSFFLIADSDGNAVQYDSKGGELTFFKASIPITEQIDVWSSQSRLFFGFRDGKKFEMYDVGKNRSHRTFQLPETGQSAKIANELLHFGFNGSRLARYDQQGTRTDFQSYNRGRLVKVENSLNNPILIVQNANEIHLINQDGVPFGQIHLPFNEVRDISYNMLNSGKTVIAVIDGLENNVYLYEMTGSQLLKRPLEGKTKVDVATQGTGLRITTVVDKFVIQYLEN